MTIHCPFCAKDIDFMRQAFISTPRVEINPTTTTTLPAVKSDDSVYTRDVQTLIWQRMEEKVRLYEGMPEPEMIANVVAQRRPNREDGSVVMHLMFARPITPMGGVIYNAVFASTATQPNIPTHTKESLETMGYVVYVREDDENKYGIKTVDDIPVGSLWNLLQYWGGERQHKRWHMDRPILASAHRNNCPAFMDGKMCSVQVWYKDDMKLHDSLIELANLCMVGLSDPVPPGRICAIMLA